jgi:hypothetical protein
MDIENKSMIMIPLKRQVSSRIVAQTDEDCFAHAISNLFLKYFKTKYENNPFFIGLSKEYTYDEINECDKLYLDMEQIYKCNGNVCSLNSINLEEKCNNNADLNSLLLYIFIYKLIVQKFGCNSGPTLDSIKYVISKIYDINFIQKIQKTCEFKEEYCIRIQELLLDNYNDKRIFIQFFGFRLNVFNPFFAANDPVHIVSRHIEHSYVNKKNKLFSIIKQQLDQNLYLTISLGGLYYFLITRQKKLLSGNKNRTLTIEEYNSMFTKFDEQAYSGIDAADYKYHSMTIVDYDYTDEQNRKIIIKNSWGIIDGSGFFYIHEKDIDYLNSFHEFYENSFVINIKRLFNNFNTRYYDNIDNKSHIEIEYINQIEVDNISSNIYRNLSICSSENGDELINHNDKNIDDKYVNQIFNFGSWKSFSSLFDCFGKNISKKINLLDTFFYKIFYNNMLDKRYFMFIAFFKKLVEYKIPVDKRIAALYFLPPIRFFPPNDKIKYNKNYAELYLTLYNKYFPQLTTNRWFGGGKKTKYNLKQQNKKKTKKRKY